MPGAGAYGSGQWGSTPFGSFSPTYSALSGAVMSNLRIVAEQIGDKISDLILGPVQGSLTAVCITGHAVILQGTEATLPDGRIVRVRASTRVTTTPTPIPVRLLYLTPSHPNAGQFNAIGSGLTASWTTHDANVDPHAITSAFAPNAAAVVGAMAEADYADGGPELFASAANGRSSLVLLSPEVKFLASGNSRLRMQQCNAKWRLRATITPLGQQKDRRITGMSLYDSLQFALLGATAGSAQVAFDDWSRVKKETAGASQWDLTFHTPFTADGRQRQPANISTQPVLDLNAKIIVNNDHAQISPFEIDVDIQTT